MHVSHVDFAMDWNLFYACLVTVINSYKWNNRGQSTKAPMPISKCWHDLGLYDWTFCSCCRLDAEVSITLALNLVYLLSLVLQPFMPTTSDEIRTQLNIKDTVFALEDGFRCYLPAGHTIGQAQPLFKRIEKAMADDYRARFAGQRQWGFYFICCYSRWGVLKKEE